MTKANDTPPDRRPTAKRPRAHKNSSNRSARRSSYCPTRSSVRALTAARWTHQGRNARPSTTGQGPEPGPASAVRRAGFEDIGDIFADLFAAQNAGGQRRRPAPEKGADIRTNVTVSLPEAVLGTRKRVSLPGGRALDLTIPAGVGEGQVLRLKGQGQSSLSGGPAGALLVEIKIAPHPYFRREGDDIRLDLPISLKEAVLGGQVRAPTLDGDVEVRIPAGASSGSVLRLKGRGVPKAGSGQRGDQLIRLMIDLPSGDPELEDFAESWRPPTGYDPRRRLKG